MASSFELKNRRGLPHKNPFRDRPDISELAIKPEVMDNKSMENMVNTLKAQGARECLEALLSERNARYPALLKQACKEQLELLKSFLGEH